jgi:uncharacterized protein YegP (UPF0339 family)
MKYRPQLITIILCLFLLASCKDFIEPSLTKREVKLLAPGEDYPSKTNTVTFWWDVVDDATAYRLQVVTPGFDSIGAMLADTLVRDNKFLMNLPSGNYQWRVRAENNGTQTGFSKPGRFIILSDLPLNEQVVLLSAPADNTLFNSGKINLRWTTLYGVLNYRLQVDTNDFADTSKLVVNKVTPLLQSEISLSADRRYRWRVRAENDSAQSRWSEARAFSLDQTPPIQVTPLTPATDEVVTLPVALRWNAVSGAARYKLYIMKSDSTTLYNSNFPVSMTATSYNFNSGNSGERLYWKVSAVDPANNEGQASRLRSFIIQ